MIIDPDETFYQPSHLELHCLQRYLYRSVGMKVLKCLFLEKKQIYLVYIEIVTYCYWKPTS